MKIAIIGATGCIGSSLLYRFANTEDEIIAFYRREPGFDASNIKWIKYDLAGEEDITPHLSGVDTLYYFVHSLDKYNFQKKESDYSLKINEACKKAGCSKIIYLGGILHDEEYASAHLYSRKITGENLAANKMPVVEFRASIVLSKCSDSYKIASKLADKLPVMLVPKWLSSKCSPIYVDDLVEVLHKARKYEPSGHQIFNIGLEATTYKDLLNTLKEVIDGKRLWIMQLPFMSLKLSSIWIWLITGTDADIARNLSESLIHDTDADPAVLKELLGREPIQLDEALKRLKDIS